jgi:hypothetical protein
MKNIPSIFFKSQVFFSFRKTGDTFKFEFFGISMNCNLLLRPVFPRPVLKVKFPAWRTFPKLQPLRKLSNAQGRMPEEAVKTAAYGKEILHFTLANLFPKTEPLQTKCSNAQKLSEEELQVIFDEEALVVAIQRRVVEVRFPKEHFIENRISKGSDISLPKSFW